jgi:inosose dehydratase
MTTTTTPEQRFRIGYHLNSWDLAGRDNDEALAFLAAQGFPFFEVLASTSLDDQYTRQYMGLGQRPPVTTMTDTRLFQRLSVFSRAERTHGIAMSAFYLNAEYTNPATADLELDQFEIVLRILAATGSRHLVVGGGAPALPGLAHSADEYDGFATALTRVGRLAADHGIALSYHPHIDTFIETREQLDQVVDRVDTDVVGLCVDTAHLVQAHSDPVAVLRDYIGITRYVHFKDTYDADGLTGVARYQAFCELGAGLVDFPAATRVLLDAGFDGPLIVELDMTTRRSAEESCLESIDYIRDGLGLVLDPTKAPAVTS